MQRTKARLNDRLFAVADPRFCSTLKAPLHYINNYVYFEHLLIALALSDLSICKSHVHIL